LTFEDAGEKWGFTTPTFSNGAAYGDLDNDGDLDLVINNVNQEAFLYKNRSKETLKNHHLAIQLKGKDQNTFAIGSTVTVHRGSEQLNFQLFPARGFQSSVDCKMVFGLGQNPQVDSVVVVWPDRTKSVLSKPPIDTTLAFSWENSSGVLAENSYNFFSEKTLFQEVSNNLETHREDDFVDFYQEGLSYRMLSREGPRADVADVSGDGRDDIFIGGATGQPGQLYLQTATGTFARHDRQTFDPDSLYEDTAITFFDADGDKDPDLFVGSGGNAQPLNSRFMQSRIYLNDGKGHFTQNQRALPLNGFNTAVAVPLDFDADGDLDLFVGSRSAPAQYGVPPRHFLYENNGKGNFRDAAKVAAPDLPRLGMVTDAKLVNLVGDAAPELVVVGEWRNPKIFEIKNKQLVPVASNLDNYSGWWYALESDDVDGDGDQDLILGNRGENFYFTGNQENTAKLWVGDFDQNGQIDKILTRQVGGKDLPVALKRELTGQIPSLKKASLKHADYAKKSIQDLFSPEVFKQGIVMEGNYFQSAVALNDGKGQFTLVPLPKEVQFSSVNAIWCGDLNADGKNDLVLGGNDAGFMPQFSKLDASFGHVLLNKGSGQFEWLENRESGFFLRGDVKQIVEIKKGGERSLVVLQNGEQPKILRRKPPADSR
jgi:hypothetical protein